MRRLMRRRSSCWWKAMKARTWRWKMSLRSRRCRIRWRRKRFRLRRRLRWRYMASRLGLPRLMLPRLSLGFILCCGTAFSEACYPRRFVRDAKKKPDTRNRVPRTLQQFVKGIKKDRPLQFKGSGTRKGGRHLSACRFAGGALRLSPTMVRLRRGWLSDNRRSGGCPGPALSGPASSRPSPPGCFRRRRALRQTTDGTRFAGN